MTNFRGYEKGLKATNLLKEYYSRVHCRVHADYMQTTVDYSCAAQYRTFSTDTTGTTGTTVDCSLLQSAEDYM